MPHTDDITQLSAVELAALIRDRRISCREVTNAFLTRIETLNPAINAICTLDADRALDTADALDRDIAAGRGAGRSLMGLPIVLKDLTPTAGIRTTRGSRLFENWVPSEDAALVTRLKDQGAVVLGKTNTPEFGHKAITENAIFGPTANPWRLDRIAGGSSGGSAAAVAAALVPFAEGSDGAGSIRIPASLCGTVGFKPTFGRVPDVAQSFFSHTPYFHNGPIARSVADADLLYRAMLGPTAGGLFGLPFEPQNRSALRPLGDIRVGYSPDLGIFPVRADVAQACRNGAKVFEALGCQVIDADLTLPDDTEAAFMDLWRAKVAGLYGALDAGDLDLLEPVVQTLIEDGRGIDMVRFGTATKTRDRVWQIMTDMFAKVDILLCPTTCVTAFGQSDGPPSQIAGRPVNPLIGWFLTYPMNMTGHPVISVPCGVCDDGLPVGLQIAGKRLEDDLVLRLAADFEAAQPWDKIADL